METHPKGFCHDEAERAAKAARIAKWNRDREARAAQWPAESYPVRHALMGCRWLLQGLCAVAPDHWEMWLRCVETSERQMWLMVCDLVKSQTPEGEMVESLVSMARGWLESVNMPAAPEQLEILRAEDVA
jgi:hypothetical protein